MKAIVVYESFWGNTAAVARAVAEGLGPGAKALATDEADAAALAGADLIVAGAPVIAFGLTTDTTRPKQGMSKKDPDPDLSHPPLRDWLASLPKGAGRAASFQTRVRIPLPATTAPFILKRLERTGYKGLAKPQSFYVVGSYGPLHDGELERAREWGATLARMMG